MRLPLLLGAAAALLTSAALADAPVDARFAPRRTGWDRGEPGRAPVYGHHRRHRGHGHGYGYGYARRSWGPGGPVYGAEPPYFPGLDGASPSGGFGTAPVTISEYRDAYIGHGLIYNVPPQPFLLETGGAISVRY